MKFLVSVHLLNHLHLKIIVEYSVFIMIQIFIYVCKSIATVMWPIIYLFIIFLLLKKMPPDYDFIIAT